jgi:hypothetical protein
MNRFILSFLIALALAAPALAQSALTWRTEPGSLTAGDARTHIQPGEQLYLYGTDAADTMPNALGTHNCWKGVQLRINQDYNGALVTSGSATIHHCESISNAEADFANLCIPYMFWAGGDAAHGANSNVMVNSGTADTRVQVFTAPALGVDITNALDSEVQVTAWCLE